MNEIDKNSDVKKQVNDAKEILIAQAMSDFFKYLSKSKNLNGNTKRQIRRYLIQIMDKDIFKKKILNELFDFDSWNTIVRFLNENMRAHTNNLKYAFVKFCKWCWKHRLPQTRPDISLIHGKGRHKKLIHENLKQPIILEEEKSKKKLNLCNLSNRQKLTHQTSPYIIKDQSVMSEYRVEIKENKNSLPLQLDFEFG